MNYKTCELRIIFFLCFALGIYSRPTLTVFGETRSSDGQTNTYNLNLFDKSYPIKYHITGSGNRIDNISAESDNATLLVNLISQSNGILSIELPRNVIDSKKQGNADDQYIVFEDGQATSPEEIKTNSQTRTLAIDFDKGTAQIEIAGSKILPEFGQFSPLILAITTAGVLVIVAIKCRESSVYRQF